MPRMTALTALCAAALGAAPVREVAAQDLAQTANPELVGQLAKELHATPKQAEGAAGALFGAAKSTLAPADWGKVAAAVPGMDGLLKAAPDVASAVGTSGAAGALAAAGGAGKSIGGLASAASAFSKLGLKPEMAKKAVPILTQFVTKSGGAD